MRRAAAACGSAALRKPRAVSKQKLGAGAGRVGCAKHIKLLCLACYAIIAPHRLPASSSLLGLQRLCGRAGRPKGAGELKKKYPNTKIGAKTSRNQQKRCSL